MSKVTLDWATYQLSPTNEALAIHSMTASKTR